MVIPAGSPTDCLGRFNPFESFSDANGFGKFLNNCFRPDSYVHGFVDGMASCFSSAFIAPLVQIQTDLRIYVKFAAALVQGDTTTAANILQIKGERDRRNFDAFIRSIGPSLNPQVIGASEARSAAEIVREFSERIAIHTAPTERAEAESVVASIERMIGGASFFSFDSSNASRDVEDVPVERGFPS